MGIKTKFNPMGGGESDKGKLSDWRYVDSNSWQALAYGNNKFVALGLNGHISTSTDGTTWTTATQNSNLGSNSWQALAYDGTKFVALGDSGYISTSTDGTTWTNAFQSSGLGSHFWRGIAYGYNKFVASSLEGYLSTSTEGTIWTKAEQDINVYIHGWEAIVYGNNKFVALGRDGYVSISITGTTSTWTTATQNSNLGSNSWQALAYDGTKFVALGLNGHISTSTDGTTWTTAIVSQSSAPLLYEYVGGDWANIVYVPKAKGKAVINNYKSGLTTTESNTPYYGNPNVISVDLQKVPFVKNNMYRAFYACHNLVTVKNINPNVTDMSYTFQYCYNLNQNIQIPNSVTNMYGTFYNCSRLNQNIQIPNSVTSMAWTFQNCTNFNQNIQIPNSVTSMAYTFYNCNNFNQNTQIPNSVTNMYNTFYYCRNLNQNIQIPNSVTDMSYTFSSCHNLNQNIQIPNSVTNMRNTFYYCTNLNQNIQIPNSVTDMGCTFGNCYNLNQNIQIPSSVTNAYFMFLNCTSLNQNIQIPSSVTNIYGTFAGCSNLNQSMQIPNSVADMIYAFSSCHNLQGTITIQSANISNAYNCFYNSGLAKNVIFPLRYINNVNTVTRNTLVTAATGGYAIGTAVGNLVNNTTQNAVFYAYDPVSWEGYNTWTGDGTHWTLSKWAGIGKAAGTTDVVVPQEITSYAKFPTMINRACFSKNATITSLDLGTNIPWVGNAVGTGTNAKNRNAVCLNCFNIKRVSGTINGSVTDISAAFDGCYNITGSNIQVVWPDSVTKAYVTYEMTNITDAPPFGEGLTNMQSCFYSANALINYPVVPPKVTVLTSTFAAGCSNSARGNIFILANALTGNAKVAGAYFSGYNTSYRRNIYTYFNFSNGTATTTRARFASNAIYKGTSGNAAGTDPMYNSTSNFYVYNLCSRFSQIWTESSGTTSTTLLKYNTAQAIPHIAVFAQYPDYNVVSIGNNCFHGAANLKTVALYNRPFNSTNLDSAFAGCFNLFVIQGLNLSGANSMMGTFGSCYNLNQNISIPNTVINTGHVFWNCSNLNQDILIGYGTQNVAEAFHACTNFNRSVNILSTAVTNALNIFADTSASKTVYIPFKYSSSSGSAYTTTFNSFVSAGYLYSNGMSTNKHGVMVKDSHYVFWDLACVLYNTSILMSDGTYKEIKDVNVGDILKTYNEDTKDYEDNQVLYVSKNSKDDIIKVTFEDDSYIELTTGHPFLTEKGWASYDNEKTRKENLYNRATLYQLEIGDKCLTQDGSYLQITNIEREDLGSVDVYDFTIENAHTFIAGGSSSQNHHFVLHNAET